MRKRFLNRGEDINVITGNLGMHPYQLPLVVWRMLRFYKLCRTPQEEQRHRFRNHESVPLPEDHFAQNLDWMLRSCLVSHPETEELRLGYVRRLGLGMDVAIFGLELRVSDRFLSYDISHGSTVCGDPEPSESLPFTCDHLVLELWDKIISLLPTESRIDLKEQYRTKSLIAKRASQIPRLVRCVQTRRRGELSVFWESNEPVRQSEQPVVVVLHERGCHWLKTPLIHKGDGEEGK
jgi:hypothetical protein